MKTLAWILLAAPLLPAQTISPQDDRERARFDSVIRALEKAGYQAPALVGLSSDAAASLVAVLATRDSKGMLLAAIEPKGDAPIAAVTIETADSPANIGVHGVRFERFLNDAALIEVVVGHRPFQLESSSEFDRHHVLRRQGATLEAACDFDGNSRSSSAKGPRSVNFTRTVTLEMVSGGGVLVFDVKRVEETTERTLSAQPTVTDHKQSSTRYRLSASGACTVL